MHVIKNHFITGSLLGLLGSIAFATWASAQMVTITYTYDNCPNSTNIEGRLCSVSDPSGTTKFTEYDAVGRLKQTEKIVDGITYATKTTYDLAGRIASVGYPDTSTVSYEYNGPLLKRVYEGATNYAQYAGYNALGQPGSVTFSNGVATTYSYANAANTDVNCQKDNFRPCTITTQLGTTKYQDLRYAYDNNPITPGVGNITGITDSLSTAGMHTNQTQTFTYDDLSRLKSGSGAYGSITYAYDEIGKMTCNSYLSSCSASSPNYAYNDPAHRHAVTAVTNAAGMTYAYDANGNMTQRGSSALTYDAENRLVSSGTTSFVYDGDGGRVKKIGNGTTIYIGKLFECLTIACWNGTTFTGGTKHIFAGLARIASKPITTTGDISYYHADHLGSTSVITDKNGAKQAEFVYLPFGDTYLVSGVDSHYKYTGQEMDNETGLYFYNARYYDARLGRFIQPDTMGQTLRDPQDLNRYTYAGNNPLLYVDPSGHWKFKNFLKSWIQVTSIIASIVAAPFCPACSVAIMAASSMAITGLNGGNFDQIMTAGIISTNMAMVGLHVGQGVAGVVGGEAGSLLGDSAAAAITGEIVGAASGAFVAGAGTTLAYGGSGAEALRRGYQGAALAGGIAGLSKAFRLRYQRVTGRDPNPLPGEELPGGVYEPDMYGRPPEGAAVFSSNEPLTVTGNAWKDFWANFSRQGGFLGKLANYTFGANAGAVFHDTWMNNVKNFTWYVNYGTMPQAAIITYGALLSGPLAVQFVVNREVTERDR